MEAEGRHLPRARGWRACRALRRSHCYLVDGAANFLVGQGDDHPFDLAPMAKAQDVALVAAMFGPRRSFKPGVVAIGFQQEGGIGQCGSSMDVGRLHDLDLAHGELRFGAQTRSTNRQPCSR